MKKLTLVLSMLIALIGFNANAAIYLIGDAPMGGWNFNGSAGIEMEDNGDGTYSYVVTIGTATSPKTVYFAFADGWGTSWDDFNNNHRYGPQNGGQTLTGDWASVGMYGDRSFKFMGTGEEYKVTFDLNNLRAKIEGYVAPVEITTYTVVTGLNDWAIDEANDMTLENGVYTLSMENVQLSAGTFEYKVVGNHDWGNEWPQGYGNNFTEEVASNGIYNLTFTFDPATGEATCAITPIQELDDYYIVAGTENLFGSNWSATDELNKMTEGEDGIFTWTKTGFEATAGTEVQFKVVANGNWDTCWPVSDENGDNNWWYQFTEDGVYTVVITFNEETKEITLNATRTGDLPEPPQPTVDPVYIMGNVNGYSWDAISGVEMTYDQTNEVYTAEINVDNANNGLGYFGFTKKLADPESETPWDDIEAFRFGPMGEGEGNWVMTQELVGTDCELDLEGSYMTIEIPAGAWTVTVDLNNGLFKVNGTWPTDTVEPTVPEVYLFGDVNNYAWDPTQGVLMDYAEGIYSGVVTATVREGQQVAYIGFTKKLADAESETPWDDIAGYRFGPMGEGENWQMTEELLGVECALATDGSYLSVAIPAGEWTFSINLENNTFCINGEWPTDTVVPEPYTGDIFIMGNVNDLTWDAISGVQMTYDAENEVYTAEINVADVNEGKGYFGFTKKLADAESETPWDDIAAFRFGPACDPESENWVLTDELIGVDCALATDGSYKSIEVAAGKWIVTVDMVNNLFNIKKAGIIGDVNDDNVVNITDVTMLINAVLNDNYSTINTANADMNGDGIINVTDVTLLITKVQNS